MLNKKWDIYIELMQKEIVTALGCTEPVAVALAVAKAAALLENKKELQSIEVFVSRNILKNAMSVGIPGTHYAGLEYAAALGAFGGNASAGLEVFRDMTSDAIREAESFMEKHKVKISLKEISDCIYVEAVVMSQESKARSIIRETHTNFVLLEKDGEVIYSKETESRHCTVNESTCFQGAGFEDIFEFATCAPMEKLMFIKDAIRLNCAISEEGLKNEYGLQVGKKMKEKIDKGILGKDLCNMATMRCAAAIDARMAGCTLPAMSNSGSGNQGITATLPVWSAAYELAVPEEQLIRAVTLSHIVTIYIKEHMDRLSALCGAIIASAGSSCGITYLLGGDYNQVKSAVKNMIANVSGIICDGAKSSCALKVTSTVQAAFHAAYLALDGICAKDIEGIIEKDIDRTIDNLGLLGSSGMKETDKVILNIMVSK